MEEGQKALETQEFTGTAGGGAVSVKVNGGRELLEIKLKEEIVDPEDIETLQDAIMAAVNEAMRKADEASAALMSGMTGGLPF
jgi:DNA-binding YbaB/EbfC family protein